jgi:preprotein translocase subunit SecA
MAGRGTDIQLGGNFEMRLEQEKAKKEAELGRELTEGELSLLTSQIKADIEVKKKRALDAGGLYVLGTERHESRRIDNQLRGRTGRQGDPGKSKFYISIEDDLMRIFAAERMDAVMRRLGIKEDEGITHPWMNKAMETSQRKIEQRNFEIRKNVLKYDDVINDQRKAIFEQRMEFMRAEDVSDVILEMREHVIDAIVSRTMPEKAYAEQWDVQGLREAMRNEFAIDLPVDEWAAEEGVANKEIAQRIRDAVEQVYQAITTAVGADQMHRIEKQILLQVLDMRWREHLQMIDQLRSVIHLRSYGQRDPLNEFKSEAFNLFHNLLEELRATVTRSLMHIRVQQAQPEQAQQRPARPGCRKGLRPRRCRHRNHLRHMKRISTPIPASTRWTRPTPPNRPARNCSRQRTTGRTRRATRRARAAPARNTNTATALSAPSGFNLACRLTSRASRGNASK